MSDGLNVRKRGLQWWWTPQSRGGAVWGVGLYLSRVHGRPLICVSGVPGCWGFTLFGWHYSRSWMTPEKAEAIARIKAEWENKRATPP
jgi:hypothetical protein